MQPTSKDGASGARADARASRRVGWLPAFLPADARRFRVADPRLRNVLATAGAELVADAPDVEIGAASELRGDAGCAIVPVDPFPPEGGNLAARAARMLTGPALVRARAERARATVRRLGYDQARVVIWERESSLRLSKGPRVRRRRGLRRPPPAAIVTASRSEPGPTALEASAAAASEALREALHETWPLATMRMTIVLADEHVLRVAIGAGTEHLRRQREILGRLQAGPLPAVVAERLPKIVDSGRAGLAEWTAETRLPGRSTTSTPEERFLRDCLEFLVGLHECAQPGDAAQPLSELAATVSVCCSPRYAPLVPELAAEVEERLRGVPRIPTHGDFWGSNLLAENGRLRGVIDWETGRAEGLPLADLYHLLLSVWRARARLPLGAAVVHYLLPLARAGGDEAIRDYCTRVGLPAEPAVLEALVVAYWLSIVPTMIDNNGGLPALPLWTRDNVDAVLASLGRAPRAGVRPS